MHRQAPGHAHARQRLLHEYSFTQAGARVFNVEEEPTNKKNSLNLMAAGTSGIPIYEVTENQLLLLISRSKIPDFLKISQFLTLYLFHS